jgi:23S rRNA (cytosine1962-C5)-methyltransferase
MEIKARIRLKRGKEHSASRFHPWIFSGAIHEIVGQVVDGSWVELIDYRNSTIGFGHYQNGSISVRILSFGTSIPSDDFWLQRMTSAMETRRSSGLPNDGTDAFRLIHAEGDGLPGLIIDVYNRVGIIQAHSFGMHADRKAIADALQQALPGCTAIYYKSQTTLPGKKREEFPAEYLFGQATVPHIVHEYGNQFFVNWEDGQKTGFFLDQRENRDLLSRFSRGKRVLNTFCYTGGFSVSALRGGASLVHSVDASEKAIELTRRNLKLNGFDDEPNKCFAIDTFEFLKDRKGDYDVIVLDPPAFAKHRDARHQAIKGYQRLNTEAMKAIATGGILFTFSCSQVVDRQLFYDTIVSSGIQSGRRIKVLNHLSQPADHPVSLFHPEGEYLKGLVLYIE